MLARTEGAAVVSTPDMPGRVEAYEDALRTVAAATVRARARVSGFRLAPGAGEELLVECERALSALIALGHTPGAPDNHRPLLAYNRPDPRDLTP